MNRPIRRIGLVLGVLLVALLVNITIIQVVLAGDYRERTGNQRVLLEEYDRERGPILVGSKPAARAAATARRKPAAARSCLENASSRAGRCRRNVGSSSPVATRCRIASETPVP